MDEESNAADASPRAFFAAMLGEFFVKTRSLEWLSTLQQAAQTMKYREKLIGNKR